MSFMAKGATRAPRKGVRCGFDLLARYDIIYTTPRSGSLQNLTARSMLESFHPMRGALERMLCGYYAADLALNFTAEADPCPGLYRTLLESLRGFATGERLGLGVLLLELAALKEHGTCPAFDECAACQARLLEGGRAGKGRRASFSPSHGGPLCRRCVRGILAGPATPLLPVSTRRLALLADLAAHPTGRADAEAIPPKHIVAAGRLLRFHMQYLLGKELRMWKYLQQRHMSRTLEHIRRAAKTERA
jgi:DNA repair protein RecO